MSNKTISSNLFMRISAITLLISLVLFLGLSMPNNAYGDSKEGKGEANASENANKVEDDINDIEDDLDHVEDSIDVEEDANDVSDDINETDDCTDVNGVCVDDCTDINCTCADDANCTCVDDCNDSNDDSAKNANSNSAAAGNVNKADDCVDINDICSDDDCDCADVNGVCVDDCKEDNNTKKNASTNNSSVGVGVSLEINKEKTLNNSSNSGTLSSAVKEINSTKEIKSLNDGLKADNSASDPVSEIGANEQLGAKEIIKLFFENVALFFTNILDKII